MKRYLTLDKPGNGVNDAKDAHLTSEGESQDPTEHTLNEKSEAALLASRNYPDIRGKLEDPTVKSSLEIQCQREDPKHKRRKCILLVVNETTLRGAGKEFLEQLGYEVVSPLSSLEALDIFRQTPHRFDLVVTDHTMPNLAVLELAQNVIQINASTPIIICTNGMSDLSDVQLKGMGIQAILVKPIGLYELAGAIRKVLGTPPNLAS